MAKVIGQSIPSEYADLYGSIARPGTEMIPGAGLFYTQRRYPWNLPKSAGVSPFGGSPAQNRIREIFKSCCGCFAKQPDYGGATPPTIGARSREWWWIDSEHSDLFYFNWFMQKSLISRLAGVIPDWCKISIEACNNATSNDPNHVYAGPAQLIVQTSTYNKWRTFIKWQTPNLDADTNYFLYAYMYQAHGFAPVGWITHNYKVHEITTPWNKLTLTWNTQPAIGNLISEFSISFYVPIFWWYDFYPNVFLKISVGIAKNYPFGVRISLPDEAYVKGGYFRGYSYVIPAQNCFLSKN